MFGYIFLLVIIIISSNFKSRSNKLIGCFIGVFMFSAIRYGIGYDYYSYCDIIYNFGSYRSDRIEIIPRFIMLISNKTSTDLFFVITSLFISYFYYKGIKYSSNNYIVSVLFYLAFPFFFMDQLSIIRQAMATAIIFWAITEYQYNKIYQIGLILLAFLCHQSALIGIIILLPLQKMNNKLLWGLFICSILLGESFVKILPTILNSNIFDSDKFITMLNIENFKEGNFTKYLLYFIFSIFLLAYRKLISINDNNKYFIAVMCVGVCLFALFGFNIILAKRLSTFFCCVSIIIIADYIRLIKMPQLLYYITCVCMFVMLIYVGSKNMNRIEDKAGHSPTYPYKTIFNKK